MSLLDELSARGARRNGHFELSSGRHTSTFLQLAPALSDTAFAQRVGHQLADLLRGLDATRVAAPGLSSIVLAHTAADRLALPMIWFDEDDDEPVLRRRQEVRPGDRVVVVEDVLTTGRTAAAAARHLVERGADVVGVGAVVDRSTPEHPLPFDAVSLVRVPLVTVDPAACDACAAGGTPIDPTA